MGKTGKWLKSLLTGKKEKEKDRITNNLETRSAPVLVPAPKEKKRWSFRRSAGSGAGKDFSSPDKLAFSDSDIDQKRHAMAVAVATAAAADAAVAAAQAAAAVVRLTSTSTAAPRTTAVEAAAAVTIQSVFRSYLARKALRALKGLVKLQALVRGHLVRKQATATLRCMQALVTVQARARAQRIRMIDDAQATPQRQPLHHRRSPQNARFRQSYDMERNMEEGIKIVEMDLGYSIEQADRMDHRFSTYSGSRSHSKLDPSQHLSPAPSALTDMSLGACSGHFEDFSFTTAQSSPHYYSATSMPDATKASFIASNDYPFVPNYMAKTQSSRAKARSQSAPKQRPDSGERPPSRRRSSMEGRNIPRSVRMQRSSSLVGASVNEYQYPWSIKLDKSNMSIKDSECGSTSTVLTNTNYSRSLYSVEVHGK